MLSTEIQRVMESTRSKSGVSSKMAYIKSYINDPEMKEVIRFAMSPFITFGIGGAMMKEAHEMAGFVTGESNFSDETWELLEQLANRELTGSAAVGAIAGELNALNSSSQTLLTNIIGKNLKMNLGAKSINKLCKDLVPTYNVSLAHKFSEHSDKVSYPAAVEVKLDGTRILAEVRFDEDGKALPPTYRSREGLEQFTLSNLNGLLELMAEEAADVEPHLIAEGILFDGEVTVGSFRNTQSELKKKDHTVENPTYTLFWMQSLEKFVKGETVPDTYSQRRMKMRKLIGNKFKRASGGSVELVNSLMVTTEGEIHHIYGNARAQGLEGVIVKNIHTPYEYKRNTGWLKIKDKQTLDLYVVDVEEGEAGTRLENNCGAIVVDYKGTRVSVGSGLSDDMRQAIWDDPDKYIDSVAEISFHELTETGSLRHPVFECFRDDKKESDSEEVESDEKEA